MKRKFLVIVIVSVIATAVPLVASRGDQSQTSPSCVVIQQALEDYGHIKAGATRSEIEKHFVREGGAQFPGNTRYVYPKCPYLHVDINFEAKGAQLFSPEDVVTEASRLYVNYSAKD